MGTIQISRMQVEPPPVAASATIQISRIGVASVSPALVGTIQISQLRTAAVAIIPPGTVQVSAIAVATPINAPTVQVSQLQINATALNSPSQTLEPYALVVLSGSGWTQTAGPTTSLGSPAPAGPNGYTLHYTGPGEAAITVLPHTAFFDPALTRPAQITDQSTGAAPTGTYPSSSLYPSPTTYPGA